MSDTSGSGNQWRCPDCGKNNREGNNFCYNCGAKKPEPQAQSPQQQQSQDPIDYNKLGNFIEQKVKEVIGQSSGGQTPPPTGQPPQQEPQPFPMPFVEGKDIGQASASLRQWRLMVDPQGVEQSDKPAGTVVRTEPIAGDPVKPGDSVKVWISSGQPAQPPTPTPTPSEQPWTIERLAQESKSKAANWKQVGDKEFEHSSVESFTVPQGTKCFAEGREFGPGTSLRTFHAKLVIQ